MTKEEKGAVYDRAIKLLSNQDYSEFKIKKKLASLGLNSEKINLAIEKIKKENIINDDRYKKNVVRKFIYKGFSPV
jgi:SOS response regulatory protein OraA/RecX